MLINNLIEIMFWLVFLNLSIEDTFYQKVDLITVLLCCIFFSLNYSFLIILLSLFLVFIFKDNKYIGEADIIFLPMALYITGFLNISFYFFILIFGLGFLNLRTKSSPMLFPIFLSTLISNSIIIF